MTEIRRLRYGGTFKKSPSVRPAAEARNLARFRRDLAAKIKTEGRRKRISKYIGDSGMRGTEHHACRGGRYYWKSGLTFSRKSEQATERVARYWITDKYDLLLGFPFLGRASCRVRREVSKSGCWKLCHLPSGMTWKLEIIACITRFRVI